MMFGVAIQAPDARAAIAQIERAEAAGVQAAWATMFGAGGGDMIPVFAAAASRTSHIRLGTAIVHTWGRHPVVLAQEAAAIDQIAPGRFRLGLGSTTKFFVERLYGQEYRSPLANLREYLQVVRALLHEGKAEFAGEHVRTRARLGLTADVPVLGAALRTRSFEVCGEVADGAISWMCPRRYIEHHAAPALARGAAAGQRDAPALVAHVPFAVGVDRAEAHARARQMLAMYANVPNYQAMFAQAGYEVAGAYGDDLLDDLVVHGSVTDVVAGLRAWLDAGATEVLAHPLVAPGDAAGLDAALGALAEAGR
jgi:F420-dependent oxidoreductase-like protein